MPSSRGSSPPRDQISISCVSCILGKFFTCFATRENHIEGRLCSGCMCVSEYKLSSLSMPAENRVSECCDMGPEIQAQ